ncbi:sulfatase family protein [Pararhodonellum marinum]|uniref:sulfatase family protein n=1 Tax=Pararhodonellum marinum TaxID=2755358 RepID=UPI00188DE08F|nr:sulfatase [Pararhodonellum marinum]
MPKPIERSIRYCLICLMIGFAFFSCKEKEIQRPNIAWFVSEDNSPYLGVYGNTFVRTPTLDSMARAGILYTNAFSNAPVCAPSRSGIITGVLPVTMGSQHMRSNVAIADQIGYFTSYLKEAGYFNSLRKKRDYNIDRDDQSWHIDDWWAMDEALAERTPDQPFFMFYNTWMTHEDKLHGQDKARDYFRSTFAHLPQEELDMLEESLHPIDPAEISIPGYLPDIPEVRSDMAKYLELMEMMDHEFKMFLDHLREIGELDNTIIIYSSDHGGVMARSKRFPFETGLKVPLFIWFPEKYQHLAPESPGTVTDRLVTFLDITPSILNLAGLEKPGHMQGAAFWGPNPQKEAAYAFGFRDRMDEAYDLVRTIRDKKYRYTKNFMPFRPSGQKVSFLWKAAHVPAWEKHYLEGKCNELTSQFWESRESEALYDTENDPFELYNLAQDPAYQETLETMRSDLLDHLISINDLGFVPEGLLYQKRLNEGLRYDQMYASDTLESLIRSVFKMTQNQYPDDIRALLNHQNPAFQFWGILGVRMMDDPSDMKQDLMDMTETTSGDVKVALAEACYIMGEKETALDLFRESMATQSSYVLLRTLNTLEVLNEPMPLFIQEISNLSEENYSEQFGYPFRVQSRILDEFKSKGQ